MRNRAVISCMSLFILLVLFGGCSAKKSRRDADRDAYEIIDAKSEYVEGMREGLRLERNGEELLEELPEASSDDVLPDVKDERNDDSDGEDKVSAVLVDLEDALRVAARNSREYRREQESVFLQALELSSERNRFHPEFFWGIAGETGYDTGDHWTAEARSKPGLEWLWATGARLQANLSTTATRFLSGDSSSAARSVLDLTLTQPLLKDGRLSAVEPLAQAERDMVYELRDFVRFQRRFAVGVLNDYYRVLESRQRVENERINHDNIVRIRRRAEALAEAGRVPELQVDRARQDELSASDSLDGALQRYREALDDFKLALGLSPGRRITLDPADLDRLDEKMVNRPPVSRSESIELALDNRLDLATIRGEVQDARRRVEVAREELKPGLDVILGATANTPGDRPVDFGDGSRDVFGGLDADLPLERTDERNTYRRRLVELARAERDYDERRDEVVLEVTNRWRELDRARSSHQIQRRSVEVAEERVESTELLFDAGRATMRDVLDAREDLLRAQNRMAQTIVDLRVSTLKLEQDLDILVVEEDGRLREGVGYDGE